MNIRKIRKRRQLLDKVDLTIDSHQQWLNICDYRLNEFLSTMMINNSDYLVNKRRNMVGILKEIKPRVK